MRKALFPMIASLALCGAATAALVATNAHAEQGVRKPMMIALVTPDKQSGKAAPHAEGGLSSTPREAMAGREQVCNFLYARKAGELAFLEARLSLSASQTPLFTRWKQTSLDLAKQHQSDCAGRGRAAAARGKRLSVVDRLALEEELLKRRLSDIQTERPALSALYASLTPSQKQEFGHGDRRPGRMRMMMLDHPHPGLGPMRRGDSMGPDRMEQLPEPR